MKRIPVFLFLIFVLSCNNSVEPESVVFKVEYFVDGGNHIQIWFTNEAKELESVEIQQNISFSKIQYIFFPIRQEPKQVTLRVKSLAASPQSSDGFALAIKVNGESAAFASFVETGEFDLTITADLW